jgi:thiamine-monophosphate kinase
VKVSALGEFGLIDLLQKMIAEAGVDRAGDEKPIIGIGDDAAAWRCEGVQLATVDTMTEDIHFSLDTITWKELGWKSLAINLSDIAAMGGTPRYALIAIALPDDTRVEAVRLIYEGMIELARESGVVLVGGNVTRAAVISLTIMVLGNATGDKLLRRSAARPDDVIVITGYPGGAAGGLEMLTKKLKLKNEDAAYLRRAFLHPQPRLVEGQILVKHGIAAAIDTSDGLLADLGHICEASAVSARVEVGKVPLHEILRRNFKEKALEMALGGGEDYELIFTGPSRLIQQVKKELKCPVTVIGKITSEATGRIDLFDEAGQLVTAKSTGWAHF